MGSVGASGREVALKAAFVLLLTVVMALAITTCSCHTAMVRGWVVRRCICVVIEIIAVDIITKSYPICLIIAVSRVIGARVE